MSDPSIDTAPAPLAGPPASARIAALPRSRQMLLERLRASRDRVQHNDPELQSLRGGSGDPIVLLHAVGGDLFCYGELVRRLPPGPPIVGLGPDDLLRADRPPSIQDLAQRYLARLDEAGIRPGVLAGWSFGGVLALEMARHFAGSAGRRVGLVMIDSMPRPPQQAEIELTEPDLIDYFCYDLSLSTGRADGRSLGTQLRHLPTEDALRRLHGEFLRDPSGLELSEEEIFDRYRIYVNATKALQGYEPGIYSGPVHLMRASYWDGPHQAEVWRPHLTGAFHVHELPAHHHAVLREPALAQVVGLLRDLCRKEEAEAIAPAPQAAPPPPQTPTPPPPPTPPPAAVAAGAEHPHCVIMRIAGELDVPRLERALAECGAQAQFADLRLERAADGNGWLITAPASAEPDLPALGAELERRYAAMSAVQRISARDDALDYWRTRLDGSQPGTWPYDTATTSTTEADAATGSAPLRVELDDLRLLEQISASHWVHEVVVLATALQVLLARVSPTAGLVTDVTVAASHRARTGEPGSETVILRQRIDPDESFAGLVRRAAADALLDHHNATVAPAQLEQAMDRRLFEASLVLEAEAPRRLRFGAAVGELVEQRAELAGRTLTAVLHPSADGLAGTLYYDSGRLGPAAAQRVVAGFIFLLRDALRRPDTPVGDLDIAALPTPASKPDSPVRTMVIDRFDAVAARFAETPALKWPGGQMTYAELSDAANRVAAGLSGAILVGLYGSRSPRLAVALIGVLRAGAGYVPLDPSYPAHRLSYMLSHSGTTMLVTEGSLPAEVSVPDDCRVFTVAELMSRKPASDTVPVTAEDLAYVMYTSGSTGDPKGVAMPHGPLANMIEWQLERSAATAGWNTLQFAPISFDASFQEIFATWCNGGTLVLVDDELRRDPRRLLAYLVEQQVHRLFLPFVALRLLAETAAASGSYPTHLREVITAGEQLRVTAEIRRFFAETGAGLDNQYGPTEAHVVTAGRLGPDPHGWPVLPSIGRAITGASIHLLDARLRPLPDGVPGEICIGGRVLAKGYVGRPDLTDERFVSHPDLGRVYRTGDLGRSDGDGRIEFRGRNDSQVKVRGYRVEPGEIEAALCGVAGVADAVVIAEEGTHGASLTGYCVPVPGAPLSSDYLRDRLTGILPDYMVPVHLVVLERFPLTPSGKVDRGALGRPAEAVPPDSGEPMSPTEEKIANMYRDLLGVPVPRPASSFFELGGDSLSLARLATRLEEQFGPAVPVADLFTHNTVAAQALLVDRLFLAELEEFSPEETAGVLAEMLAE